MKNNLKQVFSDIVSVDAWYAAPDNNGRSKVHVDLSFRIGAIGAEDECEITFKISLKRAVLRLVVPVNEPFDVIQSSVDRDPAIEGVRHLMKERHTNINARGNAKVGAALSGIGVTASGQINTAVSDKNRTTTEISQKISTFNIRQYKDIDDHYCWELTSETGQHLEGKVWDPVKQPRFSVKQGASVAIPPILRAHVLCRRKDIDISEVRLKKGNLFLNKFLANRTAAAQAVIRQKILSLGLDHPKADNDLIEIKIADTLVVKEII